MAHFAQLDGNNIVTQVIVVNNIDTMTPQGVEDESVGIAFCQSLFGMDTKWKQTSYTGSMRKNYAGVRFSYDAGRDAFIPPTPYNSWVLDESTCTWTAPTPYPNADDTQYIWDEDALSWVTKSV